MPVKVGNWGDIFIGKSKMAVRNFYGMASSQTWGWGGGGGHFLAVSVRESQFPGDNLLGFGAENLLGLRDGSLGLYKQVLGIPD